MGLHGGFVKLLDGPCPFESSSCGSLTQRLASLTDAFPTGFPFVWSSPLSNFFFLGLLI